MPRDIFHGQSPQFKALYKKLEDLDIKINIQHKKLLSRASLVQQKNPYLYSPIDLIHLAKYNVISAAKDYSEQLLHYLCRAIIDPTFSTDETKQMLEIVNRKRVDIAWEITQHPNFKKAIPGIFSKQEPKSLQIIQEVLEAAVHFNNYLTQRNVNRAAKNPPLSPLPLLQLISAALEKSALDLPQKAPKGPVGEEKSETPLGSSSNPDKNPNEDDEYDRYDEKYQQFRSDNGI